MNMVNYNAELYETELSLLEQSEQLYLNFVNFLSNLYFVFFFSLWKGRCNDI